MTTIDVHSHIIPDSYRAAMEAAGMHNVDGFAMPAWNLEDHIEMMDDHKIQACVVSVSAPGLSFANQESAATLARTINLEFAETIRNHPARFGAFALLPMPDIDASLKEIAYALDVLKLDGIGVYTNYAGVYLGNPKFAPVLDELHRRKAVVFVHPMAPPHSEELALGYPAPMLEYPFDSTRMVVSLLDTDTLARCNHIRFIVCHGGGTLPLLTPRIAPMMQMKHTGNKLIALAKAMFSERQVGHLFFDLAAATHPAFLAAIKESQEPSKLLMGFDYPFMPAITINGAKSAVQAFEGFSEKDKAAIDTKNAQELFPRLADAMEHAA